MISNVLLKMPEHFIFLHDSKLDNFYAINLDHISPMHLSCLKTSLDDVDFGIVGFKHAYFL